MRLPGHWPALSSTGLPVVKGWPGYRMAILPGLLASTQHAEHAKEVRWAPAKAALEAIPAVTGLAAQPFPC